ncbi:hypothetical protein Droror1_Dr00019898 [Drosera rotundifolia]
MSYTVGGRRIRSGGAGASGGYQSGVGDVLGSSRLSDDDAITLQLRRYSPFAHLHLVPIFFGSNPRFLVLYPHFRQFLSGGGAITLQLRRYCPFAHLHLVAIFLGSNSRLLVLFF